MELDGFTVQGRGRKGHNQEPVRDRDQASFLRQVPRYSGTSEEFTSAHSRLYRDEEKLRSDGSHPPGSHQFPPGSQRSKDYNQYSASTRARDVARRSYQSELSVAQEEFGDMEPDEQAYYEQNTGGLPPDRHERLDPRAQTYADKCYSNAYNRHNFLQAHPQGYHSKEDQQKHHGYAGEAYREYETASRQQRLHAEHRSFQNADTRVDKYGRRMSSRR